MSSIHDLLIIISLLTLLSNLSFGKFLSTFLFIFLLYFLNQYGKKFRCYFFTSLSFSEHNVLIVSKCFKLINFFQPKFFYLTKRFLSYYTCILFVFTLNIFFYKLFLSFSKNTLIFWNQLKQKSLNQLNLQNTCNIRIVLSCLIFTLLVLDDFGAILCWFFNFISPSQ